jgi:hypothetical protein
MAAMATIINVRSDFFMLHLATASSDLWRVPGFRELASSAECSFLNQVMCQMAIPKIIGIFRRTGAFSSHLPVFPAQIMRNPARLSFSASGYIYDISVLCLEKITTPEIITIYRSLSPLYALLDFDSHSRFRFALSLFLLPFSAPARVTLPLTRLNG